MDLNWLDFLDKEVALPKIKPTKIMQKPPGCIRVATFNVRFGRRVSEIAQSFKQHSNLAQADVILLQEIEQRSQEIIPRVTRLAKLLNMDYVYVPSRRLPLLRGTHGAAILSRLPLQAATAIRLPVYPLLRLHPRVAISAELDFLGRKIKIYNVHLNGSLNYKKRAAQLSEVIKHIYRDENNQPVILGGDFNTIPLVTLAGTSIPLFYSNQKKKLHAFLKSRGFETSCQHAGHTSRWGLVQFQLDGIYPKNGKVAQYGVERQIRLSDHFPLWADIRV